MLASHQCVQVPLHSGGLLWAGLRDGAQADALGICQQIHHGQGEVDKVIVVLLMSFS